MMLARLDYVDEKQRHNTQAWFGGYEEARYIMDIMLKIINEELTAEIAESCSIVAVELYRYLSVSQIQALRSKKAFLAIV